jgi:predicted nucleotide-binding protein (sugar kinase/HSP70/actin superfamily)
MDLSRQKHVGKAVYGVLKDKYPQLTQKQVSNAVNDGYQALKDYQQDIIHKGEEIIKYARENGKNIIVIAGRPYHIDKEVNHGIHKLMSTLDLAVVTEDSVAHLGKLPQLEVLNQWTYHSRLYKSAQYVTTQPDMQLVQLVSFGCGIDAITTDEVRSILERNGKLYTQLKIDEISNLGAVKIRLRSLITAIEQKKKLNNR